MKQWVTQIMAVHPKTGGLVAWIGPLVPGETEAEAQEHIDTNGLGYCRIVGQYIGTVPYSGDQAKLFYGSNRNN